LGEHFLPAYEQSQFEVSVHAPEGSTLAATSALVERVAADIRQMPGVTDTLVTIGGGQQQTVNLASIYVKLTDLKERNVSQTHLMVRARTEILGKYLKQ